MATSGYQLDFNQDFTSISIADYKDGFRIFSINNCDDVEEIYARETEELILVGRLFNTSLVAMVTAEHPNCLQMINFKKNHKICHCGYGSNILSVRMNRTLLITCLAESIHIHNIQDMKMLHKIDNIAPNEMGLCSLSLNSHLAYPISSTSGELRIFNASTLQHSLTIQAHESRLSALNFSPSGQLLATASERGTVIRVFCVKNGQRVQEFRRGTMRCVRIASLVFSIHGYFLSVTSNTETVHIFKIDEKAVMMALEAEALKAANIAAAKQLKKAETKSSSPCVDDAKSASAVVPSTTTTVISTSPSSGWSDYLSKTVSSFLLPTQVSDVLAQDRAFATVVLAQPGKRHLCGITYLENELKVLIASEEGFLYIHDFNEKLGGVCKLQSVHDLRGALDGVVELSLHENLNKMSTDSSAKEASPRHVSTINADSPLQTTATTSSTKASPVNDGKSKKSTTASPIYILQDVDPVPENSYAAILRGQKAANALTADSAKYRKLCDAIDTPTKLYDERQFPPMAIAARD